MFILADFTNIYILSDLLGSIHSYIIYVCHYDLQYMSVVLNDNGSEL